MGIRYKCSVCKNYDFCEMCEDRQAHEHPFIKVVRPENAPTSIITAINEEEPAVKEEEINHGFPYRGHRGGHCGRGGRGVRGFGGFRQIADHIMNAVGGTFHHRHATPQEDIDGQNNDWAGVFGEKRSKWSEQRAIIISKPKEPVVGSIGEVILVHLEILNSTKWPWKQNCCLMTSPKQSAALQGLVINRIQIDCDVKGM